MSSSSRPDSSPRTAVPELEPGLILVHGNQAEALRDVLLTWMRGYPLAPLENEVMLVQSNGIAQWLKLALAADPAEGGQGIAAAINFSLPSRFVWQAYRAVLGAAAVPETSPFDESRLVWRLMRMLPQWVAQDDAYLPLQRFLRDDRDQRKCFQLAQQLADLFDQYQVYRADWLAAWESGEDVLIDARGQRRPLPEAQRWQAALWRAICAELGGSGGSRAAVHTAFLARMAQLAGAPCPAGLPRRVMVFGLSALPRQALEVLAGIARWTQILMCVHNPCEHYWADSVSGRDLLRASQSRQARKPGQPALVDEDLLHAHAHPLLAAWGKQGRDTIAMLDEFDEAHSRAQHAARVEALGQRINLFLPPNGSGLLAQLQDDMLNLRSMVDICAEQREIDAERDGSLRFHVAHSPLREIEILHDQLLAAFNADSTLRPRDVIVMVPDIDAYAPHIEAVFGLLAADDPRYIPFSLADHGQRHADPLVHALSVLLELPQSRLGVSTVLDLLDVPAVRRRFGIEAHDLPQLRRWIAGANIRWGLNGAHRESLSVPAEAAAAPHTWLFGLRRMLLGYAVGSARSGWEGIDPYPEVAGLAAVSLGALLTLIERLERTWQQLRQPADVATWRQRLTQLLRDWFDVTPHEARRDAYTLERLDQALEAWEERCVEAGFDAQLPLSVVMEHWLGTLDAGGLSQRFFAGAVTFATLMPMRAIPFRYVCLLGMNDGDFPRQRQPLDFDLMARDYRPGDRSRREDDRYLFLEALLSARECCYISWVGRSIRDNSERPPSVLVGQLRDHIASGWRLAGEHGPGAGEALLDALTTEHPLQAFSPRYFERSEPVWGGLFTYAHEWRRAGRVADEAPERLPPLRRDTPLTLDELIHFLRDPARGFLRQRLGVHLETEALALPEQEPFELDGLARWRLQGELLQAQTEALQVGADPQAARARALRAMYARGEFPAGALAELLADELLAPMDEVLQCYRDALARWPAALSEHYPLQLAVDCDGVTVALEDWLGDVRRGASAGDDAELGRVVIEVSDVVKERSYRGDKLLPHWVRHVAAQLAVGPLTTVVLSKKGQVTFGPLPVEDAAAYLRDLLALWYEGMQRPLPFACASGFDWVLHEDEAKARQRFEGNLRVPGEGARSAYLARVWGDFDALTASGEFYTMSNRILGWMGDEIFREEAAA